jgi:hypothetical protein
MREISAFDAVIKVGIFFFKRKERKVPQREKVFNQSL